MKTALIILGAAALVFYLVRTYLYHQAIRHGRCPICGAPIEPFSNGVNSGYRCTECDWWDIVDDY